MQVHNAIQRFEQDTSTKFADYMMDKEFGKSSKLFFLHVDLKIRTTTAYCRRMSIMYFFPFPVLFFWLLFSKCIFFITCKLQTLKLPFTVRQQIRQKKALKIRMKLGNEFIHFWCSPNI